jgi:hypothetical protein
MQQANEEIVKNFNTPFEDSSVETNPDLRHLNTKKQRLELMKTANA